ncbi:MAG: uroporphyrinogen-III C-methyltransferase [Pseudomonadota bacterium]
MTDAARPCVLVTRPREQSAELSDALKAAGYDVDTLPALAIAALPADVVRASWQPDPAPDFAVFVSTNAVRHGYDALALGDATRRVAIGRATADALRERGAADVLENPGVRSEDLLTLGEFTGDLTGRRVLIVRGDDGRDVLRETLTERGATVDVVDVYRRELPDISEDELERVGARVDRNDFAAIVAMSLASLENLGTLLGESRLAGVAILTPSPAVVDRRNDIGLTAPTLLADGPDAPSLVRALDAFTGSSDSGTDDAADVEADMPDTSSTAAAPPPAPAAQQRSGGMAARAALLLSVVALALSALTFWRQQSAAPAPTPAPVTTTPAEATPPPVATIDDTALTELRAALDAAASAGERNRAAIADVEEAQAGLISELNAFGRQIGARQDLLESLPGRVENVEQSVAGIQNVAAGTRTEWLLAEAEYYLQLANAQLQLARNPTLAAYGLELADQRVRELADPAYTPVRRALANEIRSLAAVTQTDLEGIALTLASLSEAVPDFPLRDEIARQRAAIATDEPTEEAAPTADEGRLDRLWRLTREQIDKGFRVRKLDESLTPLLSPEASYFLRTNLVLKFDSARLALLRGEQQAYEQSLEDAAAWLAEYFDNDDPAIASALTTLAELMDAELATAIPDISGSLALLRRTRTLATGGDAADEP